MLHSLLVTSKPEMTKLPGAGRPDGAEGGRVPDWIETMPGWKNGLSFREKFLETLWEVASESLIAKLAVCGMAAIPLITPVELLRDNPCGRLPEDIDQL